MLVVMSSRPVSTHYLVNNNNNNNNNSFVESNLARIVIQSLLSLWPPWMCFSVLALLIEVFGVGGYALVLGPDRDKGHDRSGRVVDELSQMARDQFNAWLRLLLCVAISVPLLALPALRYCSAHYSGH